jgi:thiol-disulfide isomerase/thioredoxin
MIKKLAVAVAALGLLTALALVAFQPSAPNGSASPTAFDLPALSNAGRVRLDAYRGMPVVVTLYASWCSACITELPEFARAAARLRGRVQFIAVDSQETADGAAFARRFHLPDSGFVLARDIGRSSTGGLYKAYGAHGLPATVFYSPSGAIEWKALEAVPDAVLQQQLQHWYGV